MTPETQNNQKKSTLVSVNFWFYLITEWPKYCPTDFGFHGYGMNPDLVPVPILIPTAVATLIKVATIPGASSFITGWNGLVLDALSFLMM